MVHSIVLAMQENLPPESEVRNFLDQLLVFLYTLAHWFGSFVADIISTILNYQIPQDLVDPIGILILLTLIMAVAEVAKKLSWLVIVVGWILILLRVILEIFPQA